MCKESKETYICEMRPVEREVDVKEERNMDVRTKRTLEERYAGRRDLYM